MPHPTRRPLAALALTLVLASGCRIMPVGPTPPSASARPGGRPAATGSAAPAALPAIVATLAGKVKLLADAKTGLVSDHAGGLTGGSGETPIIGDAGSGMVSDHGGGIISNNTGAIIANNGGAVVANNGGAYRLAQAGSLAAFALADAEVTFSDAAGRPLTGADGQPLVARTDATGSYALTATVPGRNFVARVALRGGGELRALVVPDAAGSPPDAGGGPSLTVNLDTASTIGAAYVLDRLVKGDQAVYDRLPRAEAERLGRELAAFGGYLVAAPSYRPQAMAQAAEALAARVPAVGRVIEDVKALLLGQARLGEGRLGTEVALGGALSLHPEADGTLLIGEGFVGRVRRLAADGRLTMLIDAGAGQIKANFIRLTDMARAADGTLWAVTKSSGLYRVTPAGAVERMTTGVYAPGGQELAMTESVAVAPDGTLYVGEFTHSRGAAPRLWAFQGETRSELAIDPTWDGGRVSGLAVAPDGALLVTYDDEQGAGALYRWQAGKATRLATFSGAERPTDLAVGPDGTPYVLQSAARRVVTIDATGAARPIAGAGAPVGAADLLGPNTLAVGPDGTLWVADLARSRVFRRTPAGAWAAVAGAEGQVVDDGETTDFAINQPTGMVFDAQGALYVAEVGSSRVRRFQDGKLETYAGSTAGSGGDGGPATQAQLAGPTGLAFRDGELLIAETAGRRVRAVAKDGTIRTILGGLPGGWGQDRLDPGVPVPAAGRILPEVTSLAVAADGRLYATTTSNHQLLRLTPGPAGDRLEVIAGRYRPDSPDVYLPGGYLENQETDPLGVLGFPCGLAVDPQGRPVMAEMVAGRVMRVEAPPVGAGLGKLVRVGGRDMATMMQVGGQLAGSGKTSDPDDVPATETTLVFPTSVAYGPDGSLYVAEAGTIHFGALGRIGNAGGATGGFLEIAIDAFAMPRMAGRVRKIAPDGTITTVAGRGTRFFPADSGDDALVLPMGLAIAPDGRLAIADLGANMIRILPAGSF